MSHIIENRQLDQATLTGYLWESANILRGPVDAADFKTYIFPLLFFKRVSDVYDEEFAVALEESGGDLEYAQFPENHRFQLPEGSHWRDVRALSANIGHALQNAMRAIEQANPDTLYGIFGDAQWANKDRLSDSLLKDLVEHFSSLNLGNRNCQADLLGQAYEYLIKKFADLTNKKAGEFYTPRSVVALMVRILAPKAGETIYDPACGTGGMLLEALHPVKEHGPWPHRRRCQGSQRLGRRSVLDACHSPDKVIFICNHRAKRVYNLPIKAQLVHHLITAVPDE